MWLLIPFQAWEICINGTAAGTASIGSAEGSVAVDGISAMVLVQGDSTIVKAEPSKSEASSEAPASAESAVESDTPTAVGEKASKTPFVVGGIAVVAAAAALGIFLKKKK